MQLAPSSSSSYNSIKEKEKEKNKRTKGTPLLLLLFPLYKKKLGVYLAPCAGNRISWLVQLCKPWFLPPPTTTLTNIIWVADLPPSLALTHPYPTGKVMGITNERNERSPQKQQGLQDANSHSCSASIQQAIVTNQQTNGTRSFLSSRHDQTFACQQPAELGIAHTLWIRCTLMSSLAWIDDLCHSLSYPM